MIDMCVLSNQEELLRSQRVKGGALEDQRWIEAELQALRTNHRLDYYLYLSKLKSHVIISLLRALCEVTLW